MVKQLLFSLLSSAGLLALSYTAHAAGPDELAAGLVNPGYVDKPIWFKESFLDIREDLDEATASNKRLLLYFYQDGCPYCAKLLNENLSQQDIVEHMQKDFDVIAINMWGDNEVTGLDGSETTEKGFAVANKVLFTPTMLFLDEQGNHVLRVNGYYHPHKFKAALDFVSQKLESKEKYRDYLARVNPQPASGKLHDSDSFIKPPYDLSRKDAGKPLLVMFEQLQCPACDELHTDILQQQGSAELLDKFDVVVLDMWSKTPVTIPDGNSRTVADWARELRIGYAPSLVYFDKGKEVFRTEAWLRTFHIQSGMDYVASGAYMEQPEFQRYIDARADALRAKGIEVDLLK